MPAASQKSAISKISLVKTAEEPAPASYNEVLAPLPVESDCADENGNAENGNAENGHAEIGDEEAEVLGDVQADVPMADECSVESGSHSKSRDYETAKEKDAQLADDNEAEEGAGCDSESEG